MRDCATGGAVGQDVSVMSVLPAPDTPRRSAAFLAGARTAATSVFVVVITVTYVGFGALAHDFGFSVGWAMLSTLLLWAGPAQVILVTALGSGSTLIELAVAVGLSSVRLLPMVVALLPLIRPARSRFWQLVVPTHFIAVSVWVEAMRLAPGLPRDDRIPFCNGIGVTLIGVGTLATAAGFYLSAALPLLFGAAAMFVTPLSFLVSTARNSRLLLEKAALGLGLVIGPVFAFYKVELDLLWTGIVGGSIAYVAHRVRAAMA
jgi:predicted branched-subunit amino acid permease